MQRNNIKSKQINPNKGKIRIFHYPFNIIVLLFLILGFITGLLTSDYILPKRPNVFNKSDGFNQIRAGGFNFINPLLECESFQASDTRIHAKLKSKIKAYVDKSLESGIVKHISVYYRNLNNGPWIGINEHHNYTPASLLKVPILIATLKKTEAEKDFLSKNILYSSRFDTIYDQNIGKEKSLTIGNSYTIDQLLDYMIVYSDNEAKELLIRNIGNEFIVKVMRDMGVNLSEKDISNDFISVKEYSSFFRILYNASYLNREMSEKALELLSRTDFKDGIPAKLPNDIIVSHKFGERGFIDSQEKQLHDCGIVYLPNNPYLICIMTKGDNFNNLIKVISELSEIVYLTVK